MFLAAAEAVAEQVVKDGVAAISSDSWVQSVHDAMWVPHCPEGLGG